MPRSEERKTFTLSMLRDVVKGVRNSKIGNKVVVASKDERVINQATELEVVDYKGEEDINKAFNSATEWLSNEKEAEAILVLPRSIPLATAERINRLLALAESDSKGEVIVVPSRYGSVTAFSSTTRYNKTTILGRYSK